jgi:hypothetical protein
MKITSTENIFTDFFCDRITILSALANNVKKKNKQTNNYAMNGLASTETLLTISIRQHPS